MKILLAVDGSPCCKRMLAYLAAHDEWLGNRHDYTLVHAVPPVPGRAAAKLEQAVLEAFYDDCAEQVFKPIRRFFTKQGLRARYISKAAPAARTIAEEASRGRYDLVIMGTHGHGALAKFVLGSVATKVIAAVKVPVLLVR